MKSLLESSRYLAIIAVLGSLLSSAALFLWGGYKVFSAVTKIIADPNKSAEITSSFLVVIDTFLVAVTLLIFAVALYELFIGDLDLPEWLVIHDLFALKEKLSSVIIVFMGILFLEELVSEPDGQKLVLRALAITLVSGALIALNRFIGQKHSTHS